MMAGSGLPILVLGRSGLLTAQGSLVITGTIEDTYSRPVSGARISDGSNVVASDSDGSFAIESTTSILHVTAAGYADRDVEITGETLTIQLEEQSIRALYLNPQLTNSEDQIASLIDLIDRTNANAVVIDIKEDSVWYDTEVRFFQHGGTVEPLFDAPVLVERFHDHGIQVIARLVVFKDPLIAEAYPELAIRHWTTGELWRDGAGTAWVNPLEPELWTANIDLAIEAATIGFDEIQYDYIRFPSDGDLSTMDFGTPLTEDVRIGAVEGFLAESRTRLLPMHTRQSADVFAWAMSTSDDIGIGQRFSTIGANVDYLSPMIYPSHYSENQFGLQGHPNDFPYDVTRISLEQGLAQLDTSPKQVRPWLQDFDLAGMRPYGPNDVREQVRAVEELGASGWMLWDWTNRYNEGNLDPESPATPISSISRSGRLRQ